MVESLAQLIDLQELDTSLTAADGQLASIPTHRDELAAKRAAADARLAEAKDALTAAEAAQRLVETELQDKEALLAKLDGQQHQVKSNDAYAALLREMEEAKEAISAAETQILEGMETIESASAQVADVEREVKAQHEHCAGEEATLDARERELQAKVEGLRAERSALAGSLPGDLATQYDRIAQRCTPAAVRVVKEVCQGCRVNIPPQLHIELMNAERLHVCPNCRRILIPESVGK